MPSRDLLPRTFSELPAPGDDDAIVGQGPNLPIHHRPRLRRTVGRGRSNQPDDVATVETLLRQTGDLGLRPEFQPTGLFSVPLADAIQRFQRRNGLARDGIVEPDGETIVALERESFAGDDDDQRQREVDCVQNRVDLDNLQNQIERQHARVLEADERVRGLSSEAEELLAVHDAQLLATFGVPLLAGLNAVRLEAAALSALRQFVRSVGDSSGSLQIAGDRAEQIIAPLLSALDELETRLAELDQMQVERQNLESRRRELGCP